MDLRLDNARISFAQGLWTASAAVEGGIKKYNCDYIVTDKTKVLMKSADGKWVPTTLAQAQEQTVVDHFKGDKKKALAWIGDLDARQKSIRDGNKQKDKGGEIRDGYEGNQYVHATSKAWMPVYRGDKSMVNKEEDSPIYSGCFVNARISLYVNPKTGQKGVFASMQGTQFNGDGDAFGGGRAASSDDFEEVTEGAGAEDFA
jgi:hypothetical protein